MAFQVGEFEARRRGRHILFAVEHHQFTLAEPAASDRSVPRHLDRDRDVGLALVQLAHQIVVVDRLEVELDVGMARQERSEEHTSELQSLMRISYAVFCLKKKKTNNRTHQENIH